jgi:hypothetical protein
MIKKFFTAAVIVAAFSGCTAMQVIKPDVKTGYFATTKSGPTKKATVVKSVAFDIDTKKDTLLVSGQDFTPNMVKNIGYFNNVINFKELEEIIIKNNLTDAVPDISSKIGINKAAKAYKPFLWLHWDIRKDNNKQYQQLILTDPITLEDYFISETYMDYVWTGVNDQNNYYPAFNSLIDYLKTNSKTYKK